MMPEYVLVSRAIVESERFYYHASISTDSIFSCGGTGKPWSGRNNLIQQIGCGKEDLEILLQERYVSNDR